MLEEKKNTCRVSLLLHSNYDGWNHLKRYGTYFGHNSVEQQALTATGLQANFDSVSVQKMEDKLEEVLREFKSLRDRVILQDRRIARLEEQVAKVAM